MSDSNEIQPREKAANTPDQKVSAADTPRGSEEISDRILLSRIKLKQVSVFSPEALLVHLNGKFEKDAAQHPGVDWEKVQRSLIAPTNKKLFFELQKMKDPTFVMENGGYYTFCDTSVEKNQAGTIINVKAVE